jgi:hypothetical protein
MTNNPVLSALLAAGLSLNPAAQAPGVLAFTDPDRVRAILAASGYHCETATPFEVASTIHGTPSAAADFLLNANLHGLLRGAGKESLSRARGALATAIGPFADADTVRLPAAGWLHIARRGN